MPPIKKAVPWTGLPPSTTRIGRPMGLMFSLRGSMCRALQKVVRRSLFSSSAAFSWLNGLCA